MTVIPGILLFYHEFNTDRTNGMTKCTSLYVRACVCAYMCAYLYVLYTYILFLLFLTEIEGVITKG